MKSILITGASGGIGAAIATELIAPDCSLFLHYHQNKVAIEQLKLQCEKKGAFVTIVQADLTQTNGHDILLSQIKAEMDVVIHNAGMSHSGLFTDVTDEEIHAIMNAHLLNPMKITRSILPSMIHKRKGKIIVISSIWGLTGASCEVIYSAAKGGLNSFVKGLAKEVALSNVQVNGIAPGAIKTNMLADYTEDELEQVIEDIPAGVLGQPEDIAHTVAFLCSEKSKYINGQILSVNGAWHC